MEYSDRDGRLLSPDDIYNIKLVSDAQISPNGERVVYVQTVLDKEESDYRSSLYIVESAGGKPWRLTAADAKDSAPRWSQPETAWPSSQIGPVPSRSG
jgi:dipeptidyl aminopeptidase/acylaminoacyl peptidase